MGKIIIAFVIMILAGCTQNINKDENKDDHLTIEILETEFSPNLVTIKIGETVTFVNKDSQPHWPASNLHPTHGNYPEGGGCLGSKFDACGPLRTGETYSFRFEHIGKWEYHDHINSNMNGVIIVE